MMGDHNRTHALGGAILRHVSRSHLSPGSRPFLLALVLRLFLVLCVLRRPLRGAAVSLSRSAMPPNDAANVTPRQTRRRFALIDLDVVWKSQVALISVQLCMLPVVW